VRPAGAPASAPANPRIHRKKQIRQIANSIATFGFLCPVLVDVDLNLITGHGRLLAGRQLGMTEVPTVCVDYLAPDQIRAFRIADNRLTENATWDDRLLAEQLRDLSLAGLDFDIEVTGFEMAEIDLHIASLDDAPQQGNDPADVVPEVLPGPVVSKLGDVWLLGCHRVLCGNALDGAAFAALMGEERAAMIFTDPPYRSMAMRVVSARSIIAPSRWHRARRSMSTVGAS
jgi:ParB-like chromosome segregation protein Spo0J